VDAVGGGCRAAGEDRRATVKRAARSRRFNPMVMLPRWVAAPIVALAGIVLFIFMVPRPGSSPREPTTVTWRPLAEPSREADTLLLPDLTSVETINAGGGFLDGDVNTPQRELAANFAFGRGRFGPAVRALPGRADYVFYPIDGVLDGREFTIEFWARSPRPWSGIQSGTATVSVRGGPGGNRLQILAARNGQCAVLLGSLETVPTRAYRATWQKPCAELGLTAERWHHVAVTLRRRTLHIYIDGREVGRVGGVRFVPLWSDTTNAEGLQLGGEPGTSAGIWISDVRVSRTARVPDRPTRLRPLSGRLTVDAARPTGTVPADLIGSLKIGPITPSQARSALDVIREGDTVTATPIKRGAPDATHPAAGHSGRFAYDWEVVDRSFRWLKARGLKGYIDTDATPQLLGGSVAPNAATPLIGRTYANEVPDDLDAWAAVIGDLVHHVRDNAYAVTRWTVWNEPDLGSAFWNGTMEQYLDLYAVTARAVKAADPRAKVGGPELSSLNSSWIKALFARADRDHLPLDFIAFHDYSGDLNTIAQARAIVDRYARRYGFPTPFPITIGEFNWSDRNEAGAGRFKDGYWHVRSLGAAYTTAAIIQAVKLGGFEQFIWSHTSGVSGPIRSGAKYATMQLIGDHGEQWAPFNALTGWKRTVGRTLVWTAADLPPGVFDLASKDPVTGRLGLVFANHGWAQRQGRTVAVTVKNLAARRYRLTRSVVDRAHSSRWDVAQDRPDGARQNDLQTVERRTMQSSGAISFSVRLPMWSSTFITLEPL
jgi:hypothetical protein